MRTWAFGLIASLLLAPLTCAASPDLSVRTDTDTAVLRPNDSCGPTLIESYSRYLTHELSPWRSGKFLFVTQHFLVGTGCFEGNDPATVAVEGHPFDVKTGKVDPRPTWSFTTDG